MILYIALIWVFTILFNQQEHKFSDRKVNNDMRTIKKLHKAEFSKIADLITYRALPTRSADMYTLEPFIFLNHHGPQVYPPHNQGLPFGPHPHKGFETVTFILKGDILHKDTKGHESIITEGGIQWMTAGSGVVHSEVSSEEFKEKGGEVEILQLWINLPAKLKAARPDYKGIQKDSIPSVHAEDGKAVVHLISGSWNGTQAPLQSISDVTMTWIDFQTGGKLQIAVDAARTVFLYVVKGSLRINGTAAQMHDLAEFSHTGTLLDIEASSDAVILFGHALPNKEPIVARGPFVMNTMEEIREAYEEFEEGKFGDME